MDDHSDDPIDAMLRAELQAGFDIAEDPNEVFDGLASAFTRARRVHRLRLALATASGVAVLGAGLSLLAATIGDQPQQLTVADGVDDGSGDAADGATTTLLVDVGQSESASTTSSDAARSAGVGDALTATGPTTDDETGATEPPDPGDDTTPTTTPPATATSMPPTASAPSSTLGPGQSAIETDCGTVIVLVAGTRVSIVDVDADPGYEVDIKSNGPQEIEVELEGRGGHCELHGRMRDGQLVTSTEGE